MIPTTEYGTVTADLPSERRTIVMGVDQSALAQITTSMANLYANPSLAVLRELATNARDAHIAAGTAGTPIEVHLPSALDQRLRIVDHGIGMSVDDVTGCYSQYGASSKRDTNEQAGAFGFGCKSPFAVSDQFTVRAVKDGQMTVVLFSRRDGIGYADILAETPTDAPNGVTVEVPVQEPAKIAAAAAKFFAVWPEGTVLVDGDTPTNVAARGTTAGRVTVLTQRDRRGTALEDVTGVRVVMGNVTYPVTLQGSASKLGDRADRHKTLLLVNVGIGDVDLPPSREAVTDTPRSRAAIEAALDTAPEGFGRLLRAQIDAQDSEWGAATLLASWNAVIDTLLIDDKVAWRGNRVRTSYSISGVHGGEVRSSETTGALRMRRFKGDEPYQAVARPGRKVLLVRGFPDGQQVAAFPAGLAALCDAEGYDGLLYDTTADGYQQGWFRAGTPCVDALGWEQLTERLRAYRATGKQRGAKAPTRPAITYSVLHNGARSDWTVDALRAADRVLFSELGKTYLEQVPGFTSDVPVVLLSQRQWSDTLVKRVPGATNVASYIDDLLVAIIDSFGDADRDALAGAASVGALDGVIYYNEHTAVKALDRHVHRVTNADYLAAAALVMQGREAVAAQHVVKRFVALNNSPAVNANNRWVLFRKQITARRDAQKPTHRWPLLAAVGNNPTRQCVDDAIAYLNSRATTAPSLHAAA